MGEPLKTALRWGEAPLLVNLFTAAPPEWPEAQRRTRCQPAGQGGVPASGAAVVRNVPGMQGSTRARQTVCAQARVQGAAAGCRNCRRLTEGRRGKEKLPGSSPQGPGAGRPPTGPVRCRASAAGRGRERRAGPAPRQRWGWAGASPAAAAAAARAARGRGGEERGGVRVRG